MLVTQLSRIFMNKTVRGALCFCMCSGSDEYNIVSFQVDYESEEENGEENVDENLEDEEAESEKEERTPSAEDQIGADGDESQHLSFMSQTEKEKDPLLQSAEVRVNAVLDSHPSIQDYTFDTENELWCEVRWWCMETCVCGCAMVAGSSHNKWISSVECCCFVSALLY